MQFQIEDLGPARKQVRIEIPARTVDSAFATVYNQLAQTASLPGFRKGKVPISHVRKLYQDRARFSVTERLVDAGWRGLLDEHEVVPLSEPELDANPVEAGQAFAFTMTFDVAPEIELKLASPEPSDAGTEACEPEPTPVEFDAWEPNSEYARRIANIKFRAKEVIPARKHKPTPLPVEPPQRALAGHARRSQKSTNLSK